jgi:multiple sugar transport system substrate-binding protein
MNQHRGMSRRNFLRLAGATAASTAVAACSTAIPTAAPQEKVQLVYQDWRTDWFPGMAQKSLEQFHADHPNMRVFYTPDPDDVETSMIVDMEAGTAPDVMAGCCAFFPIWAQKGHLLDLSPYITKDISADMIADWDPAQYRSLSGTGGAQYGLPKYHGALALFYNKDLFDQYKVAYPTYDWDHDDYLAAMKRLTHDRDGDGRTDLWGSMVDISWERIQMHINGWGGHFVDPADPVHSLMAAPEALAALEWIRARMWDDHVMASFLDVNKVETRQAFIDQKIAMVEDGSWALKDILAGANFRVGVAPFPAGPARKVTLATTDAFAIYARTRHPDAAWDLMKFLIGKEYSQAMARANFLQPARASLVNDWAGYVREQYPEKTKDLDLAAFADGHVKGYSVTAEVFANMADAQLLANAAWEQIFTLGQAPIDLMKRTSTMIEAAQRNAAKK